MLLRNLGNRLWDWHNPHLHQHESVNSCNILLIYICPVYKTEITAVRDPLRWPRDTLYLLVFFLNIFGLFFTYLSTAHDRNRVAQSVRWTGQLIILDSFPSTSKSFLSNISSNPKLGHKELPRMCQLVSISSRGKEFTVWWQPLTSTECWI
jgi:hypothetical protein